VVQFRSFQAKNALPCKMHEEDKVSVLKHVLCSLMNVIFFFCIEVFNGAIILNFRRLMSTIVDVPHR